MLRTFAVELLVATILTTGARAWAQPAPAAPPLTYEVQINGESFLIEANRMVKLQSSEKPDVSYDVAVRVAPTQRMRLNTFLFEYELPAKVEDNGNRENRSARLVHELGFSILLGDLGQSLEPKVQEQTLKILVESVTTSLREAKAVGIEVSAPHARRFTGSAARGVAIRYRDAKDRGHVYLVYVLTGPTFAASCVVEYLDNDSADVLPLVKKTLDSVQAIPKRR
jgi:hypothetical protein